MALFFCVFAFVCSAESFDRGFNANIQWGNSLEKGLAHAKEEKKVAFVLIHKTWCGACKRLKSVFSNAEIEVLSKVKKFETNEGNLATSSVERQKKKKKKKKKKKRIL